MKARIFVLLGLLVSALVAGLTGLSAPAKDLTLNAKTEVYFSPRGGAQEAVVNVIDSSKEYVLVQAYSFTSAPIAGALHRAHKRGVKVYVILDKSQKSEKYSSADFLSRAGIPVWIDYSHAISHNKVVVADGQVVVTGSFNFTKAAEESNAENLLVIHDPNLARIYRGNWEEHQRHSSEY